MKVGCISRLKNVVASSFYQGSEALSYIFSPFSNNSSFTLILPRYPHSLLSIHSNNFKQSSTYAFNINHVHSFNLTLPLIKRFTQLYTKGFSYTTSNSHYFTQTFETPVKTPVYTLTDFSLIQTLSHALSHPQLSLPLGPRWRQ